MEKLDRLGRQPADLLIVSNGDEAPPHESVARPLTIKRERALRVQGGASDTDFR